MKAMLMVTLWTLGMGLSQAQQEKTFIASGRGFPEEEAYAAARESALRQSGIRIVSMFSEVFSGSKSSSASDRRSYINSLSMGIIVDEDTVQQAKLLPGETTGNLPLYEAVLKIRIAPIASMDNYFTTSSTIDPSGTLYVDGQQITISVNASKDCYIIVGCVTIRNEFVPIYPIKDTSNGFLAAGRPLRIPDLKMVGDRDGKMTSEILLVIATKQPLWPLLPRIEKEVHEASGIYYCNGSAIPLLTIFRQLAQIGGDQWTFSKQAYTIVGQDLHHSNTQR